MSKIKVDENNPINKVYISLLPPSGGDLSFNLIE